MKIRNLLFFALLFGWLPSAAAQNHSLQEANRLTQLFLNNCQPAAYRNSGTILPTGINGELRFSLTRAQDYANGASLSTSFTSREIEWVAWEYDQSIGGYFGDMLFFKCPNGTNCVTAQSMGNFQRFDWPGFRIGCTNVEVVAKALNCAIARENGSRTAQQMCDEL